jgi:hypothetical protein
MKHFYRYLLFIACSVCCVRAFAQPECYLQLYPGDNSRMIFQILPDKDYADVAIYVNFYDNENNIIKQNKRFSITSPNNKYLRQANGIYSVILTNTVQNTDHISLSGIYERVPSLEFQKLPGSSLDDGDMANDASYAAVVNSSITSSPLQDISLAQTPNQIHPSGGPYALQVIMSGKTIKSSYICDLEKDGESHSTEGDFHWNVDNIEPQNGAVFHLMGYCPACFGTETYQNLKDMESQGLFNTDLIPTQSIRQGTIIAYITRNHLYGLMRIDAITPGKIKLTYTNNTGLDLKISFKTLGN